MHQKSVSSPSPEPSQGSQAAVTSALLPLDDADSEQLSAAVQPRHETKHSFQEPQLSELYQVSGNGRQVRCTRRHPPSLPPSPFPHGYVYFEKDSSPQEEAHKMPAIDLMPLSELNSLGSMRNDLTALHDDGPVCPATLARSERLLITLNTLPERNLAPE